MIKGRGILAGDAIVVRDDALLTTEVDGELMAMSVELGTCYGLNAVGTRIWALIADPRTVDSLCEQLLREYDVEETLCRRELVDLLEALRAEGLVTVRSR
jgi:hypothetical protein